MRPLGSSAAVDTTVEIGLNESSVGLDLFVGMFGDRAKCHPGVLDRLSVLLLVTTLAGGHEVDEGASPTETAWDEMIDCPTSRGVRVLDGRADAAVATSELVTDEDCIPCPR